MALTANERIIRLSENEERVNTFVNTNNAYMTNEAIPRQVKSIPTIVGEFNSAFNSALSRVGLITINHRTGSIAVDATEEFTIPITKVSSLLKTVADRKVWLRIYPTQAAMVNDRSRLITTQAVPNDLVMLDVSTRDSLTVNCCPIPIFCNMDSPQVDIAYVSIKNIDTTTSNVNLAITFVGGAI